MKLTHPNVPDPIDIADVYDWARRRRSANEVTQAEMVELVTGGILLDDEGIPLSAAMEKRYKARLLDTYLGQPNPVFGLGLASRGPEEPRWLVPGLWRWGHIPIMGGNPKAGKSTLVAELVASLLIPGRRFLDHFDSMQLPGGRDEVWLINAENPREDFEKELASQGLSGVEGLTVDHLLEHGGPEAFDLTDSDVYDQWAFRLVNCEPPCGVGEEWSPTVVIVDGITAILGGKTERVGEWYHAFRRLLREIDTPNGLALGHNTQKGTHLMGGVEAQAGADGLWNYYSDDPDNPLSRRYFSVLPRMGGVPIQKTRVHKDEDGRLRIRPEKPKATGPASAPDPANDSAASPKPIEEQVAEYVRLCNQRGHGPTLTQVRENVPGPNPAKDAAVQALIEAGRLDKRKRAGRGGGMALWLITTD